MTGKITFAVKMGPADMFRGDWYREVEEFETAEEAIRSAATRTLENFNTFLLNWEEFGYEWSVFEKENAAEKKIWEGFKYIMASKPDAGETPDFEFGKI